MSPLTQINPCSIPAFQKENTAVKWVPELTFSKMKNLPREEIFDTLKKGETVDVWMITCLTRIYDTSSSNPNLEITIGEQA